MHRVLSVVAAVAAAATLAAPAEAERRAGTGRAGIDGTVHNSTCPGPCIYPPPPSPTYQGGGLIVQVRRVSTGELIATLTPTDGTFRVRARRGLYDVSASTMQPEPTPQPTPQPSPQGSQPSACWQGDTRRVQVRRHRFTQVDLYIQNVCVV